MSGASAVGLALLAVLPPACSPPAEEAGATPQEGAEFEAQRPEFERIAERLFGGDSELLSTSMYGRMRAALADPELAGKERFGLEAALGVRALREGLVDESIAIHEELLARQRPGTQRHADVTRALGLAWLRKAELQNCISSHDAESCVFPLAGKGIHAEKEPARRALDGFLAFLEHNPEHARTRWLANVAAMALGEWPDGLAEDVLLPPAAFASEHPAPRMVDVAGPLGVDTFNLCGGVVADDFDGDGYLDVLTSTYDPLGPLTLYLSRGDGTFEDASDPWRASDQLGGLNLVGADYDGDGDVDVLVLRGAWLTRDGRIRNSLLRNDGGVLVDVTRAAGLAEPARPTQTAAWGDLDGDGDLDLIVGNESMVEADPEQDFPTQLFRAEGDGTFADVAREAGVRNDRYCKGVALGDYDNDGDLDVYLSNFGPNRLYRNDGGMRFTDVAGELGVTEPDGRSFATWFFDYDNDGWLDLFVASYAGSTADLVGQALGTKRERPRPRLYRNTGGRFREVGREAGLDRFVLPMGANFGDLDGDGWLDLYLTTGDPSLETVLPNVMLRNAEGMRFQEVTTASRLGHLQKGHGVAFVDLDNDGDQDVYHQLGGFYPGDRYHNALFRNPGHGGRYLYVELVGRGGNRDAIGARIRVRATTPAGEREIHRAVGSVSSFGGSPRRQEIGLGDALRIEEVRIAWPGGGGSQVLAGVPLDAWIRVTHGEEGFERVALSPLEF